MTRRAFSLISLGDVIVTDDQGIDLALKKMSNGTGRGVVIPATPPVPVPALVQYDAIPDAVPSPPAGDCYPTVVVVNTPAFFWEFEGGDDTTRASDNSGNGHDLFTFDSIPVGDWGDPDLFPSTPQLAKATSSYGNACALDSNLEPRAEGMALIGWMNKAADTISDWHVVIAGRDSDGFVKDQVRLEYQFDHFDGHEFGNLTARFTNYSGSTFSEVTVMIEPDGINRFGLNWDGTTLSLIWNADIIGTDVPVGGGEAWDINSFTGTWDGSFFIAQDNDTGNVGIDEIHYHKTGLLTESDLAAQWAARLVLCPVVVVG